MKRIILLLLLVSVAFTNAQEEKKKDTLKKESNERFLVKNVGINNEYSSFGTTFFGDTKIVYCAQNEKKALLDLYQGTITKNGEIINPTKIESLSTKSFESNVAFTKDGKSAYFTRSVYGKRNTKHKNRDRKATIAIFKADITASGKWKNIKGMPFNSKKYDVGHPTLNKDNTKLYFTSNMPGTLGDTDIFVVDVLGNENYSQPRNMGDIINSKDKEAFPHIEGNILYFSSTRQDDSYGRADIYAVKIYEDGKVSNRLHLAPPVNSIADDFSYIFNAKRKRGYFSSNRVRGKGKDDIYSFTETRPLIFDCYQDLEGEIFDLSSGKPIPNAEVILINTFNKEVSKTTTGVDGKFRFKKLTCSTTYQVTAVKKHYAKKSKEFVTTTRHNGLSKIRIGLSDAFIVMKRGKKMLNIDNINFDYDKSNIRPDAAAQLNLVVATMRRYPKMVIELGAHTDSRGGDAYNLKLSDARAQSTIRYIIDQGEISADRISGKGYGETRLLNHCDNANRHKCTKKEHEINRRSEFVITKM